MPGARNKSVHTFELTIHRRARDGWPVVAEEFPGDGSPPTREDGLMSLDSTALDVLARESYGEALGVAIFQGRIRASLEKAVRAAAGPLHVTLCIEDAKLRTLRWERLSGPLDGKRFVPLALDQRVAFSINQPSAVDGRFPPIGRRDLKALVVAAMPSDHASWGLAWFDPAETLRSIRQALSPTPSAALGPAEDRLGDATLDGLRRALTDDSFTLLHVVCHGRYRADDGEPTVYLCDSAGATAPILAGELIDALSGLRRLPYLTFLSACDSAAPEAEGVLGSLARRLVGELGLPAIVAMTDRITVKTASLLAEPFYRHLRAHGEVDVALVDAYAALTNRPDVQIPVPVLLSRIGGRPLFSDTADRDLSLPEITEGLGVVGTQLETRAPVLCPAFKIHREKINAALVLHAGAMPEPLRDSIAAPLAAINEICGEVLELSFRAVALGQEPLPYRAATCPFRGLYAFTFEDHAFFFGREHLIETLQAKLAKSPVLPVYGPSGSGKSSVVLAGLLPRLVSDPSDFVELNPGPDPLAQLASALARSPGPPSILVVDQFEETFSLCHHEPARREFVERLLALAPTTKVILTIREDFLGDCDRFGELRRLVDTEGRVPRTDATELREVMERQARAVGLRFQDGLASRIFDDVRDEPGAMPLLQHALLELWNRRHGHLLKDEEYEALGTVRAAIARTAEQFFLAAEREGRGDDVRDVFLRLTRPDPDRSKSLRSETRVSADRQSESDGRSDWQDTRRRIALDAMVPHGASLVQTRDIVQGLAARDLRLVMTSRDPSTGVESVEVAHEALIANWPRLQGWLRKHAEALKFREDLGEAARRWIEHDRDPDLIIHRGRYLTEVVNSLESSAMRLNDEETNYLSACKEQNQTSQPDAEPDAHEVPPNIRAVLEPSPKPRRRLSTTALAAEAAVVVLLVLLWVRPWEWRRPITSDERNGTPRVADGPGTGKTGDKDAKPPSASSPGDTHPTRPMAAADRSAVAMSADYTNEPISRVVYLEQNWDPDRSLRFYSTSAGSQLLPYDWFLVLEQADTATPFRDNRNLAKLGFLPLHPGFRNPDGLAVGFTPDDGGDRAWLGLTCAACHTGQVNLNGVAYRIDGGPSLADITGLLRSLTRALSATRDSPEKFDRFAKAILKSGDTAIERRILEQQLTAVIEQRASYNARNFPPGDLAGFGRVDTLGLALNEVHYRAFRANETGSHATGVGPADAPTSIPPLWDTPHHDYLNWNGSAHGGGILDAGLLARNVSEVIGVFGEFEIPEQTGRLGYPSSIRVRNIVELQNTTKTLSSPVWPDEFPKIDVGAAEKGKDLYAANCLSCHALINRLDPHRSVTAIMARVGTDSRTDENFRRKGNSGKLAGAWSHILPSLGDKIPPAAEAPMLLNNAVIGILITSDLSARDILSAIDLASRPQPAQVPQIVRGSSATGGLYKARPLNGVWATAPYLHNGSVPNLDALLRPAKDRPRSFSVGCREFDLVRVGFNTEKPGAFTFNTVAPDGTPIPANSNVGHEFGTTLSVNDRRALLEYLKTL
jgi:energy-coupling factor transporter ATP-binding protein EcfA2